MLIMANVFTKKHHWPRTTTLRDFGPSYSSAPLLPRRARILSPTRRCNPHPTGLVFQSPYNRDHTTFDIWNPNFVKISKKMPDKVSHLSVQNFTCGKVAEPFKVKVLPEIKYTETSTHRVTFRTPRFPDDINCEALKTSRFGYTPRQEARGIVPNILPRLYTQQAHV